MSDSMIASPKKGVVPPTTRTHRPTRLMPDQESQGAVRAHHESLVETIAGVDCDDRPGLLARVRSGLPASAVKTLETAYAATTTDMARCLLIPTSTLRRRVKEKARLGVDESDRVLRLARLKDLAVEMIQGDNARAIEWLRSPREILGNESPMEHASTELGMREVEDLIGRIRHGVFS